MAHEFVRNIKNAKIKGDDKEPLNTNIQNDLLSDGEDVAVRNGKEYHILTDSIKEITSKNDNLEINVIDKNTVELDVKDQGGGGGGGIQDITSKNDSIKVTKNGDNVELEGKEVVLTSKNDNLTIDKKATNEFELEVKDGGGGEPVQSDWNENDVNDPAYIKNKPSLEGYATKDEVEENYMKKDDVINNIKETSIVENSSIIPITVNYDIVNKRLKFRFSNNISTAIRITNVKTFFTVNNSFESTSNAVRIADSGAIRHQVSGLTAVNVYINNLEEQFINAINNYLTVTNGQPLSLTFIVEGILLNNRMEELTFRFEKLLTIFDNEEPITLSDDDEEEED